MERAEGAGPQSSRLLDAMGRRALYQEMCPNCGGAISDVRLELGLPCAACYPGVDALEQDPVKRIKEVASALSRSGALKGYRRFYKIASRLSSFNRFFKRVTGYRLWTVQRTWASRAIGGQSFAIVSPTGTGKTIFGVVFALYYVARLRKRMRGRSGKVYMMFPSSFLVRQAQGRLSASSLKLREGSRPRVLAYTGSEDREEFLAKVQSGDFDILLTTNQYFSRNFDAISKNSFGVVFVDDVDAILRASKNIDRVLMLIGFSREDVERAYELVRAKRELGRALSARDEEAIKAASSKVEGLSKEVSRSRRRAKGILLLSSATARPRGTRVRLFRELLGFEVGRQSEALRNIADAYSGPYADMDAAVIGLVKRLGPGGLVLVPTDRGMEYAERLSKMLSESGISSAPSSLRSRELLGDFESGKYDVLVGSASYYGKLVRGLDLPARIRYVLFAGVPHFRYRLQERTYNPIQLIRMLSEVRRVAPSRDTKRIDHVLNALTGYVRILPWPQIRHVIEELESGSDPAGGLARYLREASDIVADYYSRESIVRRISQEGRVVVVEEGGLRYVLMPDVLTYIQASGRASRLFAGGISKGLSLVVADDERLMSALIKQGRSQFEGLEWRRLEEIDLDGLLGEIDRDRELIKGLQQGRVPPEFESPMKSALLLVESPTKARTIASFFGRPAVRRVGGYLNIYEVATGRYLLSVAATKGHLFDVVTGDVGELLGGVEEFHGVLSVDGSRFIPVYAPIKRCLKCGEVFVGGDRCPRCGSKRLASSKSLVDSILSIAPEYDIVLLGTDPDSEGEKIAWDLLNTLRGLVPDVKRIEFHEVTRWALESALSSPRDVDERLVEAQIIRRVEDRWIGFELSERLRRSLWEHFKDRYGLSAGRVQTPVLGWVIQRAEDYRRSWRRILVVRLEDGSVVTASEDEGDVNAAKSALDSSKRIRVAGVSFEERELSPPPPFTTDSMLAEATRYIGTSADYVMALAQGLFEAGLITYHRTDSIHVSDRGLAIAKEYLTEKIGADYYYPRRWGPQGAHECIRPTRPLDPDDMEEALRFSSASAKLTDNHMRLYSLIFKRFMASQMRPARARWQTVALELGPITKRVEGIAGYIDEGFAAVMPPRSLQIKGLSDGQLNVEYSVLKYMPTMSPYKQSDLISLMKERGIGRPSTYAKILHTLIERRYVYMGASGGLTPSKKGLAVYDYLRSKFGAVISDERTRQLEEKMDRVGGSEADYQSLLRELYQEIRSLPS